MRSPAQSGAAFRGIAAGVVALALTALAVVPSCRRTPAAAADSGTTPTLRLYVVSTAAGALEPCGCTKDQLGGVDHAAAFVMAQAREAPHALVVGAGPTLFLNPKSDDAHATQDLWKAEALAASLGELGLAAWAPGQNDWAAGAAELERLARLSHAELLAGNLRGATAGAKATRLVDVNGYRVGIAGVSDPTGPLGTPPGVEILDLKPALQAALVELKKQGAQVLVALVAAERGRAMRLAEQVPGFHALVVGKPYDQGEGNDAVIPPALVGDTLIVQSPNHLQGVAVVDLFVRGPLAFKDGTGIVLLERRQSLEARIAELDRRTQDSAVRGAAEADVAAGKRDLASLRRELGELPAVKAPAEGSFFRYRNQEIRQKLGAAPSVTRRLGEYYSRVNDHNREAFKDRIPPPARAGDAKYIGAEACASCHAAAYKFWQQTPHASAYPTLSKQHKEFNLDCVSCHVTGYEKPGGTTVTHVKGLENVQCEACHGPGSRHEDDPTDTSALVLSPPKTLCGPACHHPPHVQEGWNVELAWSVILGKGHGKK
jgi:hypothetical protein